MLEFIEYREETNFTSLPLFYGKFYISKLHQGQGLTVGNSLRRILLNDIKTQGISDISIRLQSKNAERKVVAKQPSKNAEKIGIDKIDGTSFHEFSILPGIKESVLEISLNLQAVIFRFHDSGLEFVKRSQSETSSQFGILNLSIPPKETVLNFAPGIGSVSRCEATANTVNATYTAKDIQLPDGIEVVFPDQYIASLTGTSFATRNARSENPTRNEQRENDLLIELSFHSDSSIVSRSENTQGESNTTCVSQFPVKKVNYTIQKDHFGGEQVVFEVWTNGTIHPKKAVQQGVEKMISLFQKLQIN